eukprot:767143-Hanusia_phi.AAC.1
MAALYGILTSSITAATLANLFNYSTEESTALGIISREKSRERVKAIAADILILWWKRSTGRQLTHRQKNLSTSSLR